jgi:hypothetical protein
VRIGLGAVSPRARATREKEENADSGEEKMTRKFLKLVSAALSRLLMMAILMAILIVFAAAFGTARSARADNIISNTPQTAVTLTGPRGTLVTAVLSPVSTNTPSNAVIDLTRANTLAVGVTSSLTNSETANVTLKFDQSVDGVNWKTGVTNCTFASTGTTTANAVFLIPSSLIGGVPYWRLASIINAATNSPLSITIAAHEKQ